MSRTLLALIVLAVAPQLVVECHAEGASLKLSESIIGDWLFLPRYALPGRAANPISRELKNGIADEPHLALESLAMRLHGKLPTERRNGLVSPKELPSKAFTFEAWFCCHVNQSVGFAAIAGLGGRERSGWALTYFSAGDHFGEARFCLRGNSESELVTLESRQPEDEGFFEYWWHLVITYDGSTAKLFVNGKLQSETNTPFGEIDFPPDSGFELAAYLANEPYMELANLVRRARFHDQALTQEQIAARFEQLKSEVEEGQFDPEQLHFTAGPYLNHATEDGISIVWETNQPLAESRVEWSTTASLRNKINVSNGPERIQHCRINGLKPHKPYFYRVTAIDEEGRQIDSGVLTFQTAVRSGEPFKFAVIGDTETRPHVNNRVAQLVWSERPNFVVNLGDLTDGGMRDAKWQWNFEYFLGIHHLASRVSFFTVPGNGEGDLYWYNRYHAPPPQNESNARIPYAFRYGDAEFFMLDSNRARDEFASNGKQYVWLNSKLEESTARWKFVCFHHAPYTSEEDDHGDAWTGVSTLGDPFVRQLVPLFEQHEVDVVMFGHLHSYERMWPIREGRYDSKGVVYLLAGGAGGNLEDFGPNPAYFSAKTFRGHHYCMIDIADRDLELRMYDLSGSLRDTAKLRSRHRIP